MRAIVKFIDGGYVNIPADTIEKQDEWIMVRSGKKTMGMFDEGIVKCAYLSSKEKKEVRKDEKDYPRMRAGHSGNSAENKEAESSA